MTDYPVRRCVHEGFTIVKLPRDVDPRGQIEKGAMHRAWAALAWRLRCEMVMCRTPIVERMARNVIRFGSAAK